MKLRINPLVVADLKAIRDYIAEDKAEAASKTVDKIYKIFENIQQFPTMGADLSKRVSVKTDYKYLVHEYYITLYRIKKDCGIDLGSSGNPVQVQALTPA